MRLAVINSVCGSGSTGRLAVEIADTVIRLGDSAVVVYGRDTTDYQHAFKCSSKIDNYVHGVITRIFDAHGCGSICATKKLIRFLDKYKPSLINLHLVHGYYLNYAILFSYLKQKRIPVIWTMHDCWAFTGHCPHFDRIHCIKWKNHCYSCELRKEYPSSFCFDNSRRNYRIKKEVFTSLSDLQMTIVSPSQWLAGLLEESFFSKYKIQVINNGIDLDVFHPTKSCFKEQYKLQNKKIVLIVANGMDERKGLRDVIELERVIKDDYQFVIVGGINSEITVPKSILVIDTVKDPKELANIYSAADVFLNLTLEDNFPTVNIEALACGIPVVTYDTGGSPEIIDEKCGIVVEKHDIKKTIEAIDKAQKLCREDCLRRAAHFDKNRCLEQYAQLAYCMEER